MYFKSGKSVILSLTIVADMFTVTPFGGRGWQRLGIGISLNK